MKLFRFFSLTIVLAALQSYALRIDHVTVMPSTLQADCMACEKPLLTFSVDEPATVLIKLYDARDYVIKEATINVEEPGSYQWAWDGTDKLGRPVPPEAYHYTLEANTDSTTARYDLTDITGGEKIKAADIQWNTAESAVHFSLQEAARVSMRVGLRNNGPLLANILDWQVMQAGENQLIWHATDASQLLDLTNHPALEFIASAYTLPRNTIVVTAPKSVWQGAPFVEDISWDKSKRPAKKRKATIHQSIRRSADSRGDFPVRGSGDFPAIDCNSPCKPRHSWFVDVYYFPASGTYSSIGAIRYSISGISLV